MEFYKRLKIFLVDPQYKLYKHLILHAHWHFCGNLKRQHKYKFLKSLTGNKIQTS